MILTTPRCCARPPKTGSTLRQGDRVFNVIGGPIQSAIQKLCPGSPLGTHVYGAAAIGFCIVGIAWRDFALVWQPVPSDIPGRAGLACAVAFIFVLAGMAVQWRRTVPQGAAVMAILYSLCVCALHVPKVVAHSSQ